jgi:gluconate 2-dehydrogenase gamma chain
MDVMPTPRVGTMKNLSRRTVIKATGAVGASMLPVVLAPDEAAAQEPRPAPAKPTTYLFFNAEEAAFIEAAVARLIPADDKWPGALEAGVPNYIDKQLNGAWGAGERLYRSGPWQAGTPSQGYQLPFTPAELYRTAIAAINAELKANTAFAKMPAAEQDAYLHSLEGPGKNLGGVPSNVFFATLWECTVEGFFSDPVYGGNRDMVAWRMIGFPGAYASYYDMVDHHGMNVTRAPTSLAEDVHGHVHMDPAIPARLP